MRFNYVFLYSAHTKQVFITSLMEGTMSLRIRNWIVAFVAALLFCNFAHADVITGTQQGNADTYVVAPSWADPNQVVFSLSGDAPWGLWIYGSSYWGALPNDWAVASGVTDISQIVNASIYPLNTGYGEIFKDDFVVAQGDTGYWAVLKITNISYDASVEHYEHYDADFRWWYQNDGTGNFCAVPEPSTMLFFVFGLIGLAGYGRKKFFKR